MTSQVNGNSSYWECEWKGCGHHEESLLDMAEHQIAKHKDIPKETGIICREHKAVQSKLTEILNI